MNVIEDVTATACAASDAGIDNPLDALLGYQLRRASATIVADLAGSLDDLALKPAEASVLMLIEANPGITQSDIGRMLGIKRANMAPIAALLTARKLIDRTRADGRSQGLWLNDAGIAMAREVRGRITIHEARFLPDLSIAERDALIALVRRVWTR